MSGEAREPDQADFDLERFINMFDEALSSQDPRVIDALRNLLMIVTLTRPEVRERQDRNSGPLRRLFEDMHHLNRRMYDLEDTLRRVSAKPEEKAYQAKAYQAKAYQANIAMQASQDIAQHIDQDLINTLKIKAKGLYHK